MELLLLAFLMACPFVLASMIKKIVQDKKVTAECCFFSFGIMVLYIGLMALSIG